ncbi:MAG: hypothetical protein QG639_630 [Patescibacteria group bacterium]|jgi:hypothetical protein|nr:hypothetical protein [Patescibacteria group bacterium]
MNSHREIPNFSDIPISLEPRKTTYQLPLLPEMYGVMPDEFFEQHLDDPKGTVIPDGLHFQIIQSIAKQ